MIDIGKILRGQTVLDPAIVIKLRNRLSTEQRDALDNKIEYINVGGEIQKEGATDGILIGKILGQPNWNRYMPGKNDVLGKVNKTEPFNKKVESRWPC